MVAYDPAEWSDLFVATTGASAALLGLVFVAVSINLDRILKFEGLPERALETVPLMIGGASVLAGCGGGLYWIVAGIVHATVGAVANAWVLLVEILR